MADESHLEARQFFHGTHKADLQPGDPLLPGNETGPDRGTSKYGKNPVSSVLWTTTTPHWAAKWGDNVYEVAHDGLVNPTERGSDPDPHNSLGARVVRKVPTDEIVASRKAHTEKWGHSQQNPKHGEITSKALQMGNRLSETGGHPFMPPLVPPK